MTAFRPNPNATRELADSARARATLMEFGKEIRDHAEQLMPRGENERRGHTADSFVVVEQDGEIRVGSTNPSFFHLIEFGSAHNPVYAPLRRAVRAAGMELREHSKV